MLPRDVSEYPMEYPVTTELAFDSDEYVRLLADFYDEWADRLAQLARGSDVVVLCEGDPSSTAPSCICYTRLQGRAEVEVDRRHSRHGRLLERASGSRSRSATT